MICPKCGGFKHIYDRNESGKVFTDCAHCGNLTVEDDPILSRTYSEIKAQSEEMRRAKRLTR